MTCWVEVTDRAPAEQRVREAAIAPLAKLGCVVDLYISTDPSPRFAEMLRDYEAFANATRGSTTVAAVAARHRGDEDNACLLCAPGYHANMPGSVFCMS